MAITLQTDLAQYIMDECGENVYLCYQCKKCTAGCPVAEYFDLTPNQVLRACQFGLTEQVLNSKTIYLCAACETCSTRCPQGIDIARIMDVLEIRAQKEGYKPQVPEVPMFYKSAMRGIEMFGRMYELGLMGELYTRELLSGRLNFKQLFSNDLSMAIRMLSTAKLRIAPSVAGKPRRRKSAAPVTDANRMAYYPGCSLHSTGIEYDMSTKVAMGKLGIELDEPEGWVCCGTSPAHSTDYFKSVALPMKTLALVEESGHSYVTMPCAACFSRFRMAMHDVREDPELRQKVAEETGYNLSEGVKVDSLLVTVTDRIGYDRVAKTVVQPLEELKVVCYYGCLLTRPPEVTGAEDPEYPTNMDRLMETLGAESLDWSYKTDCCGGSLSLSQLPIALDLSRKILQNAQDVGAEAIVVACPLCQANLDMRQKQINAEYNSEYNLPIVYFTQLMGVAFGAATKELGMEKLFVDPRPLLRSKGLLPE